MTLVPQTNHLAGVLKLVPPFWGKPRITSWLLAYLIEVQQISDTLWDVMNSWILDNIPTGFTLTMLGRLVGEPRLGRDDTNFLTAIRGRIFVNRSRSTAPDRVLDW